MAKSKTAVKQNFDFNDFIAAGYRVPQAVPAVADETAAEQPQARGMLRGVADTGLEVVSGAAKGIKFMSDAFGADNAVSGALDDVSKYVKGLQSAQAQGEDKRMAQIMKEAEDKGIWEQVKAGLSAASEAPVRQTIGALATGIPQIAATMVPGLREASWGTRMATLSGLGAVQGAGMAKSSMHDAVYQRAIEEGRSPEEAAALAQQAQSYTGDNAGQIALGAGLNAAATGTGFAPAVLKTLGKRAATDAAQDLTMPTMGKALGMGVVKEVPLEATQGGQEQLAGNVAQSNAGFETPLGRGVAGSATMEGALSMGGGLVGGAMDYRNDAADYRAQEAATQAKAEADAAKTQADAIRSTKPQGDGPLSKAVGAGIEAEAQKVEAAPVLGARLGTTPMADMLGGAGMTGADPLAGRLTADRQQKENTAVRMGAFVDRNQSMLTGGGLTGNADPVANMIAGARQSDATSETNIRNFAQNRAPMVASDAARILDEAKNRGLDFTAAPHPEGGFMVVPRQWVTPGVGQQAETEIADTLKHMAQVDAAPVERAPRARADAVDLTLPTADPVRDYVDGMRKVNTPAAKFYVSEFDAGRITPADVQQRIQAERGKTPDERLADAAAQAPKNTAQPGDILNPSGQPFKTLMSARLAAQKTPGDVIEVVGGYSVRPKTENTPAQGNWEQFNPATGTLGVPRAEMPQVKTQHRGAMVNFLNARGVEHEAVEVDAATLKPTQAEFSPEKVEKAKESDGNRSILISSDGHIIDGHHQALAKAELGEPVKAIKLDAPAAELIPLVNEFPSSTKDDSSAAIVNPAPAKPDMGNPTSTQEEPVIGNPISTPDAGNPATPPVAEIPATAQGESVEAAPPEAKPVEAAAEIPVDVIPSPDDAQSNTSYTDGQVLQAADLIGYFDEVIAKSEKGAKVKNPRFHIGEVDAGTAREIATYIEGYDGKQRRLRVSGRTLKHVHESRPAIAREIVEQLPGMFSKPDEVLPDPRHVNKRALLVRERKAEEGQPKQKSYVATVEVEIEVEVSDGFIDIVTIMTAPDRSLREARDLKKGWSEGQQRTEQAVNSPHPLTPQEGANPAADFPDARPAAQSVPPTAQPAQAEAPKLTQAEAADLMEWQNMGQTDNVQKHTLFFYESKADKDAKRGRMAVATITKGDRSTTGWMVDGDDQKFGPLALAKKRGMEIGMAKAVQDGFVVAGEVAAKPEPKKSEQTTDDRDKFTLSRLSRETGQMEPVTFQRGEYVEFTLVGSGKKDFGEIDGISQARREFSVGGLWYPMGAAYKAERPTTPERKDTVPLSAAIDKVNAKYGKGLTDADRVPEQKPASKTPAMDAHAALMDAVRSGKATPEQFKAGFEAVVAGVDAIKAELGTHTKPELLKMGGPYMRMRYASENKPEIIDALYREMLGEFLLGESLTYGMGKNSYRDAIAKRVETVDADKLAKYVAERKAAIEEAAARRVAAAKAVVDPKTLDDFKAAIRAAMMDGKSRKEAYLSLTPEQRIRFDELDAESTREARETRKRAHKTQVQAAGQTTGGQIIATKHTRDGYDLFVVQLSDRLSKEDYSTVLSSAKRLGGWYSAFRGNGATPGFQFKEKASAEAFLKLAGGDTTAAQDQAAQRRDAFEDDRSQTAAERLTEMADRLEAQADEELGRDRKANTARRARFAASAEKAASNVKALAKTMRNIATAIGEGKAKFLDAVRQKTQVEMLAGVVATAKYNELVARFPDYGDREKRNGEPPTIETADFAEFPTFTAFRSDLASLARQMLEVDGTKKLGQQLMGVADDVTDAYLDFAKGNLLAVSQFGRGGAMADFSSKATAEAAIRRSGLVGKAIVLQIKRGENRVILSPSEAMNRGVWKGDGDKRITLTKDAGMELVQAIGRKGNQSNGLKVPWQFETAADRLKALSRMGIETPSEFRSAVREFISLRVQAQEADRVKAMERAMVGRRADGLDFFPTPAEVADQMVEAAEVQAGMRVLEPSAGMGHLADRIRAAGAEPDVVELSGDRRELLEEKGYNVVANDFMAFTAPTERGFTFGDLMRATDGTQGILRGQGGMGSDRVRLVSDDAEQRELGKFNLSELEGIERRGVDSGYDRIIMNPPFGDRRDAEHVRHAYSLLKPGGRLVAIMGEGVFFGKDKKADDFREWLDTLGGTSEKLPDGSFMDPSLPVTTGVNARMVVVDKPAGAVVFAQSLSTVAPGQGVSRQAAEDAVEKALDGLGMRGVVTPKIFQNTLAAGLGPTPSGVVPSGGNTGGEVYLFLDGIGDQAEAFRVVFHELFHLGLSQSVKPSAYIPTMLQFLRDPLVRQYANEWKKSADGQSRLGTIPANNWHALAVEEALADIAEEINAERGGLGTKDMQGWVKRTIGWLANLAQKWGLPAVANRLRGMTYTEAEAFVQATMLRGRTGSPTLLPDTRFRSVAGGAESTQAEAFSVKGATADQWDGPLPSKWDDYVFKLQDKLVDLKRVTQAITKWSGKLADDINVYLQEELYHGRTAKRVQDFTRMELEPALKQLAAQGFQLADLEEYMHARHAKEANRVIAERNPDIEGLQDGGSGMKDAEADAYFAKLSKADADKLAAVAAKFDAIMAETNRLMVEYELEPQSAIDSWGSMFKHYVPLHREDKAGGRGTGQGFSIKGRETKGRTGSTRKVVDIISHIAAAREKTVVRGEKNRVAQALVGLVTAHPNQDFWKVGPPESERVFNPKTGVVEERINPLYKSLPNVVMAKVAKNGVVSEVAVTFNEDDERAVRMAGALKNLDTPQIEGWLGTVSQMTRYFASINTQYNPVFGVVNLVRDVQGAMINLGATELADQKTQVAKDAIRALAGIYKDIRATRKGGVASSEWSRLYEQFQNDGGQTGFRDLFATPADRTDSLNGVIDPEAWAKSGMGKFFSADGKLTRPLTKARGGFGVVFSWLSDYNEAMENGVRLAAYKAALDKGMTRQQAASVAKNLTVNFNRKGISGAQAGAVYAFFNAAMQGTARLGETLMTMEPGQPKTLRLTPFGKKVVYGGVLLGSVQALALAAAGFDDDEPPEFVRERSLIIPTGDKSYITIPMPLGLHVIPNVGRVATEFALSGFKNPVQRAAELGGLFADAFNPIGNAGLSMQTLAPTVLDPLVALTENKDWTGKPIARVSSNKDLPGYTQYKDSASAVSKFLAEAINTLSGGNQYVAGVLSPTPDQIDYLAGQLGGGVWREISKVEQTVTNTATGEEVPLYKVPLVGRFVGSAAGQSGEGNAFYSNSNKLNRLETEIKGLEKDGKLAEVRALRTENPESRLIAQFNRAERQIQKLRREKRALIESDADTAQVKAIEQRITTIMKNMNKMMATTED